MASLNTQSMQSSSPWWSPPSSLASCWCVNDAAASTAPNGRRMFCLRALAADSRHETYNPQGFLAMNADVSPDERRFLMPTLMPVSAPPILHGNGWAPFELPHWEAPVTVAPTRAWSTRMHGEQCSPPRPWISLWRGIACWHAVLCFCKATKMLYCERSGFCDTRARMRPRHGPAPSN